MSLLRTTLGLVLALVFQAGLGRVWPEFHRFVDALLVPVVLYGIAYSQRSAMLVGCAAGLLQDTWFQVGTFGISGFKWTLLGWALGGVAARLDLNHPPGRMAAGAAASVADNLMDFALRLLLDQQPPVPGLVEFLVQAGISGLLVALGGGIVDRIEGARPVRRFV